MGTTSTKVIALTVAAVALAPLAGCGEDGRFNLAETLNLRGQNEEPAPSNGAARASGEDVEAPEVFSVSAQGLWDGRPSLGGIWVAHPDVSQPERVVIRNTSNGTSVVGALFRRERDIPGPPIQVSSDAAADLGLVAGAPLELEVVALRRAEVPEAPPVSDETLGLDAPEEVAASTLEPAVIAADAIETDAD